MINITCENENYNVFRRLVTFKSIDQKFFNYIVFERKRKNSFLRSA